MLLQLCTLAYLLGVAASQPAYYCNSPGASAIKDRDFFLITRKVGESTYAANLRCEFSAVTDVGSQFFAEISSSDFNYAYLTVQSGGRTLLSAHRNPASDKSSFLTRDGSLQVTFSANSLVPLKEAGVKMHVRFVSKLSCPPGWYLHGGSGTCYGASATSGALTFSQAQSACNSMRSNLLHVPAGFPGGLSSLLQQLPRIFVNNFTWIGLTDITWQFNYYWLSGDTFFPTSSVSCRSGGSHLSCFQYERCGAASYPFNYAVYMASCYATLSYLCSGPIGGTDSFYAVPVEPDRRTPSPGVYIASSVGASIGYSILGIFLFLFCCGCCVHRRTQVVETTVVVRRYFWS